MTSLRPVFAAVLAVAFVLAPAAAQARCDGSDMMAALAERNPAAHAEILARAGAVANGEGLLWRVTAPEGGVSHLFGTVHSTAAAERGLPGRAARALARADRLLVEMDPAEQDRLAARMRSDPAFLMDPDGPALSQRLGPVDREKARAALATRGVPMAAAERLRPEILVAMLAIPACERAALAEGREVLDTRLAREAVERGLTVEGLETYEESLAAFGSIGEAAMTRLIRDAISAVPEEEDLRATLEALYAEERVAAILVFNIWHAGVDAPIAERAAIRRAAAGLERALLTRRNRSWMGPIASAARRGGAFVAVGALHLAGETGLVALLRDRGFRVERLPLDG